MRSPSSPSSASRFAPRPALAFALALGLQAAAPLAHATDLLDVWRAATQHDPEIAAARAAHEAGAARRDQGAALWRPTVMLEGGVSKAAQDSATRGAQFTAPGFGQQSGVAFDTSATNGTATRYGLALRQPLINRERDAQRRQLDLAADAADVQWQQAQASLMLRSTQAYFDAALADEQLRLLTRQQAAVDRALAEAKDRFRLGDKPVTDVHEATARAEGLKAQRLAAETELQLKRQALADLTGLSIDGPLPLPAAAARTDELAPMDDWLARAARQNPALKLAQAQRDAAEQEARKTSAALSPTLDVVAQIGREHLSGSGDFGDASNTANQRAVGLQLTVPLYTGGMRSAQQREAVAKLAEADAQVEQAKQQVLQQTRAAWLDVRVGASRIVALDAAAQASQARLDATRTGVQAGDRTTLDLLNAENDDAAAQLALVQARSRLIADRLRLASLAGELNEIPLQQANAALAAPSQP